MEYKNILINSEGKLGVITINRPESLNALNKQTIDELYYALNEFEENQEVKVLIITGSGDKAFVAGADIKEFAEFSVEEGKSLSAEGHQLLFNKVAEYKKPIIAAVNGFALGGGLELALAAHIRVVSETAKMGLPEVTLGVIPGYGGTQRLAQLVGKGVAMEMVLTGGMITAQKAREIGLANYLVKPQDLVKFSIQLAINISVNSGTALTAAIKAINANYTDGVDGLAEEIKLFGECFGTEDFKEGTSAFLEKRKPQFK